jgi:tetratricopeptide (TPR) repeat protein
VGRHIQNTMVFSFSALLIMSLSARTTQAQTAFVLGGGYAQECYIAVRANAPARSTRATCNRALETETLTTRDAAATLVNRGIIALRERDGDTALADFNAALRLNPALSAVFLNRAGAYLLKERWQDAKTDAETALGFGLKADEWAAHFNRAVALERLGQIPEAYAAFQRAAALAPTQDVVVTELARFRKTGPVS